MVSGGRRQVEPVEPGVRVPRVVAGRVGEESEEGEDGGDHIVVRTGGSV